MKTSAYILFTLLLMGCGQSAQKTEEKASEPTAVHQEQGEGITKTAQEGQAAQEQKDSPPKEILDLSSKEAINKHLSANLTEEQQGIIVGLHEDTFSFTSFQDDAGNTIRANYSRQVDDALKEFYDLYYSTDGDLIKTSTTSPSSNGKALVINYYLKDGNPFNGEEIRMDSGKNIESIDVQISEFDEATEGVPPLFLRNLSEFNYYVLKSYHFTDSDFDVYEDSHLMKGSLEPDFIERDNDGRLLASFDKIDLRLEVISYRLDNKNQPQLKANYQGKEYTHEFDEHWNGYLLGVVGQYIVIQNAFGTSEEFGVLFLDMEGLKQVAELENVTKITSKYNHFAYYTIDQHIDPMEFCKAVEADSLMRTFYKVARLHLFNVEENNVSPVEQFYCQYFQ